MHKDILIFMSDQHSPCYSGWLGGNVDTPNLDALAADGVRFDNAYTACPLCVPARMAMMSGLGVLIDGQPGIPHGPHQLVTAIGDAQCTAENL